jgi:hypothetical protein
MYLLDFYNFLTRENVSAEHPLAKLYKVLHKDSKGANFELTELEFGQIQFAFADYWHAVKSDAASYVRLVSPSNRVFFLFAQLLKEERYFSVQRPVDISGQSVDTALHILMPGLASYVRLDGYIPLIMAADRSLMYLRDREQDYILHRDDVMQMIRMRRRIVYQFEPSRCMSKEHFSAFVRGLSAVAQSELRVMLQEQAEFYMQNCLAVDAAIVAVRDEILPYWDVDGYVGDEIIDAAVTCYLEALQRLHMLPQFLAIPLAETDGLIFSGLLEIVTAHQNNTLTEGYCLGTLMRNALYALNSLVEAAGFLALLPAAAPLLGFGVFGGREQNQAGGAPPYDLLAVEFV